MFFELLSLSPAVAIVWIVVIVLSLTVHEFSHALLGHLKGDSTAEAAGRLTLNPFAHLTLWGFVPLLLFGFGWAKPVPYNPYNLKNPFVDALHIALAGPFSNLFLALLSALLLRFVVLGAGIGAGTLLQPFLVLLIIINLFLMLFNLLPVHPLDGSKIVDVLLSAPKHAKTRLFIATYGPQLLLVLVLISLLTPFNVFFFISAPAYAICDATVGDSCTMLLNQSLR